ncbi:foldase protein PrsA [Paenibacillus marinisediminis]
MSNQDEMKQKNQNEEEKVLNEETTDVELQDKDAVNEPEQAEDEAAAQEASEELQLSEDAESTGDLVPTEQVQEDATPAGQAPNGLMKVLPWGITAVAVVALVIVLIMNPSSSKEKVATVNGESITAQELNDQMTKLVGKQVLNNMISDKLIDQEAAKAGVQVTDEEVQKELETYIAKFPSKEQFEMTLAKAGMSIDDFKNQIGRKMKITKIIEPSITIKDEDIKKYYDENKEQFHTPEQVKASHILVDTKEEADAILKELKGGADFATLAKEKSKDPSKDNGGDLGYFGRGAMVPEFEEAAFNLKVGEISDVVQTKYGYHIIKVTDKKEAKTPTYEEKKEDIRKMMVDQQVSEKFSTWMQGVHDAATIENKLEA